LSVSASLGTVFSDFTDYHLLINDFHSHPLKYFGTPFAYSLLKRQFFIILTTMKKLIVTSILAALVAFGTTVMAQDYPDEYLGLPGDNLNLYATMKLFQESETLEGFEKSLNDEKTRINNLDLNGDNLIDYITVSDYVDGEVHTIVLRAMLDRTETQDVAVFTVQKFANGAVNIQLIGDEDLYGKNYIIEPIYDETPNPGYTGNNRTNTNVTVIRTTPYEIAAWPLVRYMFVPDYMVWRSSWYWGYYPTYWNPWRPYYWHYYYGYHYNWYNDYYSHYRHYDHYRYTRYNDFYYHGVRAYSPRVRENLNEGHYKTTYSHPEQRKEGEALYTQVNPGQSRRPENTSVNGQRGRSDSQENRTQTTSRSSNGNSRQPEGTVKGRTDNSSNRQVNRPIQGENNGATQKQAANGNSRQETKVNQGQRQNDATRNTPQAYGKTSTRPSQSQGTEATRSSRQSAPKATTSRPEQSKGSEVSRSSRQSAPKATPSQTRTRSESKSNSSVEKKESKDSKSSRSSGRR
jgi:hypothetical protein